MIRLAIGLLVAAAGGRDDARGRAQPRAAARRRRRTGIEDPYHEGFSAYRWLLDRFEPPLWLHGHVHPASIESWRIDHGPSQVVNVTAPCWSNRATGHA